MKSCPRSIPEAMRRFLLIVLFIALVSVAVAAEPYTITGKVVRVIDGDTISVLDGREEKRIRLHGIDSPENGQVFGTKSKQFTSDKCFGKSATVTVVDKDRYGRLVGNVLVGGESVNVASVRAGMSWHYVKYAPRDQELTDAEKAARAEKVGVWSQPNPVPPWNWRKKK